MTQNADVELLRNLEKRSDCLRKDNQAACEYCFERTTGISNTEPLRILLVTARFFPSVGGTEIHAYEVGRWLVEAGHQVTILTTYLDEKVPTHEEISGIQVHRVKAWPANRDYFFAPGIFSFIQRGGWDIIHCQGYHTLVAPIVMLAALSVNIPFVVTFHSGGHSSRLRNALRPLQRSLLRPLLARASALVGVSRWEVDFFREKLSLPEERFNLIPNGSQLPEAEDLPVPENRETLITSVGRLERYKGHHRVIAALPLVAEKCPDVHLRIVGSGPYEPTLRNLADRLGVLDRVQIQPVSGNHRHEMASLLMKAACVILMSDYESQGVSVMEALALRRPVLVADSTALKELAENGLARATPLGSTTREISDAILGQIYQPLIPMLDELPTWEFCADQLLAIYRRSIHERKQCVFS